MASTAGYSESVLNAKIFANQFCAICNDFIPFAKLASPRANMRTSKCNIDILKFLMKVKDSISVGKCDEETFKEKVMKTNSPALMHIETLWYLLKCRILKREDVYRIFSGNDYFLILKYLARGLFSNLSDETKQSSSLTQIISSAYVELLLKHWEICNSKGIHSLMYTCFICEVSSHIGDKQEWVMNSGTLCKVLKMIRVQDSTKKVFITKLIESLLQGPALLYEEIVTKQQSYLQSEIPNLPSEPLEKSFSLLVFLSCEEIINLLRQLITHNSESIHCDRLFNLLSVIFCHYKDIFTHFKTMILLLLEDALQNFKENLLMYVFILARQCSAQLTNFPSYLQWFSSTFSSESPRPINTKEKSIFFFNFLSQMVPYELPYNMKVHINRIPWVPTDCQGLLCDYVRLIKTRLVDLNESCEFGFFENKTNKNAVEYDIETTLTIFANTNDVPKCVLEGSMFCKSYYEKKFLVQLLSKFEGKNSVRHKLISKLQTLKKVPNTLWMDYKKLM